jgi:DNA-binding response OmpR family regulator
LGAVDYVTKPFDAADLVARVETALRLRTATG